VALLLPPFLTLLAALAEPAHRRESARALAHHLGADDLLLFVPDPETGAPLPAPGFPQTLPRRRSWRAFLAECLTAGHHTAELPFPDGATPTRATGVSLGDGSTLVLLGGSPERDKIDEVRPALPLLAWALRAERDAHTAQGQATAARQAAADLDALTHALDAALRETEAAHAAAEALERRYHSLFEGVGDAVLVADAEGRYLDANAAAIALLGYTRDELQQMRVADVVAADPRWTEAEYERLKAEGQWAGELELQRRDGSTVPVEARATVVTLPTGTLYLSALRDISERRALERMQREFITMVTHELRNPLASIKGYAELMQRRGAYSEAAVDTIVTQAKQLERLIKDLLDVSRLQVGQLKLQPGETDLVALARAAAAQAQTLTHVHTIRVVAPEPPLVGRWDATRLEQVLQNLLSNAVKYSPDGGEIVVRVEDLPRQARVSVTDQGIGIPPEALPRLFQRFFRTEEAQARGIEGLGLGLHISRALVEAHGGRLWAESLPGQGSTFVFTLPRQER